MNKGSSIVYKQNSSKHLPLFLWNLLKYGDSIIWEVDDVLHPGAIPLIKYKIYRQYINTHNFFIFESIQDLNNLTYKYPFYISFIKYIPTLNTLTLITYKKYFFFEKMKIFHFAGKIRNTDKQKLQIETFVVRTNDIGRRLGHGELKN